MAEEAMMGVPILAIRRKYDLDCSQPHLSKHIDYYNMFKDKPEVTDSLFPAWLNEEDDLQEENGDYKYVGLFPWGEWITIEEWLNR
jgi:hypothetical protein